MVFQILDQAIREALEAAADQLIKSVNEEHRAAWRTGSAEHAATAV